MIAVIDLIEVKIKDKVIELRCACEKRNPSTGLIYVRTYMVFLCHCQKPIFQNCNVKKNRRSMFGQSKPLNLIFSRIHVSMLIAPLVCIYLSKKDWFNFFVVDCNFLAKNCSYFIDNIMFVQIKHLTSGCLDSLSIFLIWKFCSQTSSARRAGFHLHVFSNPFLEYFRYLLRFTNLLLSVVYYRKSTLFSRLLNSFISYLTVLHMILVLEKLLDFQKLPAVKYNLV